MTPVLDRALVSGSIAAAAVTLVAAIASRRATGSPAAALNATSHFLWRDAGARDEYSAKYTGIGAATNYAACLWWALPYEMLAARRARTPLRALANGALVAALAYVTDYHVVPRRLTPGFELRLPGRALFALFAALAAGLAARDVFQTGRAGRPVACPT